MLQHSLSTVLLAPCLGLGLALLASCQTTLEPVPVGDPWSADFWPPVELRTDAFVAVPLAPEHATIDYEAFMGSREHLQRTLGWGSWPSPDMTVAQNRKDLERHWGDWVARRGYTYAVLTPDKSRELGCIYLYPTDARGADEAGPSVDLAYWVTVEGLRRRTDYELLEALFRWIESDWPFASVHMSLREANQRGIAIAEGLGLETVEKGRGGRRLVWRRGS